MISDHDPWYSEFFPDVIDAFQHGVVRENGKDPENRFHPAEEDSDRDQDDPFSPFH